MLLLFSISQAQELDSWFSAHPLSNMSQAIEHQADLSTDLPSFLQPKLRAQLSERVLAVSEKIGESCTESSQFFSFEQLADSTVSTADELFIDGLFGVGIAPLQVSGQYPHIRSCPFNESTVLF